MEKIEVKSQNVRYTDDHIEARYTYETTEVTEEEKGKLVVTPKEMTYNFRTERRVPKLGMMLVGWGGNNGSTVTAAVLANKLNINWNTKDGVKVPNYYGSLTQASTVLLGCDPKTGEGVYVPLKDLLPMVDPNDIEFDGWDVSSSNLAESMERARVLDYNLQAKLKPHMEKLKPRPSIYYPDFIAANQADRADNVIPGDSKWEHVEKIREDIQDFKETKKLDKVIVLWTANTERFCDVRDGLNDTAENLLKSIKNNDDEVSQSTVFAVASILEGVTYINGSPQNTFVPGVVELAQQHRVFIGGDDFKSGQTKVKSVLVDFLVSSGIKPTSIVSYNHLGNNDGRNLSAPQQFKSKEVTKSSVIDDMVESNQVLYKPGEVPDHCIVIKYVPYVGDSKRAMDEYTSELMMGGLSTIAMHNTCEDSLLAAPIILDLVILAEVCQRISFRTDKEPKYQQFNSVLSILSYLVKAPIVPDGTPLVNALFRQRACIENVLRACIGLAPINHMLLEYKHEDVHTRSRVANGNVVAKENGVKENGVENGVKENGVKEEGKDEEGKDEEEEGKVEGVVASTLAAGKNAMKAMWVANGNVMAKENGVKENGVENGVKENGVEENGKEEEGKEEEGKEGVMASTYAAGKNAMKAMWNGLHGEGFHGDGFHGDELRVNGFDPLLDGP